MDNNLLGKYQRIDKLGEGTYGVVFKMKDTTTQEVISHSIIDCCCQKDKIGE